MKGKRIDVLDKGFVELVDFMGSDQSIVDSARVSVSGEGLKSTSDNRQLIRYLFRHRHCYHPDMQVLTARGWLSWKDCRGEETFLVPNPIDKTLTPETLPLEVFDTEDEEMECYSNNRMSYCVTPDHKMFFKGKKETEFSLVTAKEMPRWGHFDSGADYCVSNSNEENEDFWWGQLLGFFLGDGSGTSVNSVTFHLKKDRKKNFLRELLKKLDLTATERASATYDDAVVFYLHSEAVQKYLSPFCDVMSRATDKQLKVVPEAGSSFARGIFSGLVNSDGHVNESRNNRIEFSSNSRCLVELFCNLASYENYDGHFQKKMNGTFKGYAFPAGRTALEARKQYFSKNHYSGKVFCTTTSTGLLLVRGKESDFSFVCGNTTPFESVVFTFAVKLPILSVRQWMRSRTQSFNEMSARYGVLPDDFYIPELTRMNAQAKKNHQGSDEAIIDEASANRSKIEKFSALAYEVYQDLLSTGLAKELARSVLPVNIYTKMYCTVNLHNLFHFLKLRMDDHAQHEIRVYADAMLELIRDIVPEAVQAFEDYSMNGVYLNSMEVKLFKKIVDDRAMFDLCVQSDLIDFLGTKREVEEFQAKLIKLSKGGL